MDELWRGGPGDILIFLPGEREIRARDCFDHLRRHSASAARRAWIGGGEAARPGGRNSLPVRAPVAGRAGPRLRAGNGRRIVLATNVAETLLTAKPGIRYVVDSGLARVKRYSYRNKVERLQVEPVSQAAANQRAGRCGRKPTASASACTARTIAVSVRFTDPEILRSSLAGVILCMKLASGCTDRGLPLPRAPSGQGHRRLATRRWPSWARSTTATN
ncbi:MAG: hypothetical protein KF683_00605 [Rubrivivax sp.]|nr:hypothetical protein [Rubrivivax sp.]